MGFIWREWGNCSRKGTYIPSIRVSVSSIWSGKLSLPGHIEPNWQIERNEFIPCASEVTTEVWIYIWNILYELSVPLGNIWEGQNTHKANRNSGHKLSTFSLHLHTPWLETITSPPISTRSRKKRLVYPKGKANRYILVHVQTVVKLYLWQMMGGIELERSRWITEVGIFHQGGPAVCLKVPDPGNRKQG